MRLLRLLYTVRLQIRSLFRRDQVERDLEDEFRDHLERRIEADVAAGLPVDEARYAALRALGGVEQLKEECRDMRGTQLVDQLRQDISYACRMLRRNPGFTATVVLTLAVGVGMSTAAFSVVNAVLLRPLAYSHAERLVWLATTDPIFNEEIVPRYDFRTWRAQAESIEQMVGYVSEDNTIATIDTAVYARAARVSTDFWEIAHPDLAFGRLPGPNETDAVLLSYRLFERDFRGDASIVGRPATLQGRQVTIVGILRRDFRFHLVPPPRRDSIVRDVEAYTALEAAPQDAARSRGRTVSVVALLKPDVSLDRARAELETIRARIAQDSPNEYLDSMALSVVPLAERLVGRARFALSLLLGAAALVLVIACVNVANLLLARASVRHKEIAVRTAIGAGRVRVLRQFLTEGLLLALLAGVVGLLMARYGLTIILSTMPQAVPRAGEIALDGRATAFGLALSILTALVFGLGPALSIWRTNLVDAMVEGGRAVSTFSGRGRLRSVLVASELALAVVLLTGGGLLLRSFWKMNAHPPEFRPDAILIMKVPLSGPAYAAPQARYAYIEMLLRRVEALPGVQAVGVTPHNALRTSLTLQRAPRREGPPPPTPLNATSAGYAQAMGLRVVRGRWITDAEPTPVVVINESLARREFGDQDPVGRLIFVQAVAADPRVPSFAPIVGVVSDVKHSTLDKSPDPEVYLPYAQVPIGSGVALVVRGQGDPLGLSPAIRKIMNDIDRTQAVYDVKTLEDALTESVAPRRFSAFLLGLFAFTALLLAVTGIYNLVAYSVAQRTREIGVRMALGAQRSDVVRMVVRQGMLPAVVGIVIGLAGATALTRVMTSLLYEIAPIDLPTFVAVAALLSGASLVACCGPATLASFIDPKTALGSE
jgi:predicted permease